MHGVRYCWCRYRVGRLLALRVVQAACAPCGAGLCSMCTSHEAAGPAGGRDVCACAMVMVFPRRAARHGGHWCTRRA